MDPFYPIIDTLPQDPAWQPANEFAWILWLPWDKRLEISRYYGFRTWRKDGNLVEGPSLFPHPKSHYCALYQNLVLGENTNDIRLLLLEPGNFEDLISCRLEVRSLDDIGRRKISVSANSMANVSIHSGTYLEGLQPDTSYYKALSYVWGEEVYTHSIHLQNQPFRVRKNLYNALRRLRKKEVLVRLWVDALCIDQSNLDERSKQVRLISRIYKNADDVDAWLGDTHERELPSWFDGRRFSLYTTEEKLHVLAALWEACLRTTPHWWTRAWTFQEYAIASVSDSLDPLENKLRARFGPYAIDLRALVDLAMAAGINTNFLNTSSLMTMRAFWVGLTPRSILRWTGMMAKVEATDPRDKIYAFLSLCTEREASLITPDYNKPVEEVFAQATFAIIAANRNLGALYASFAYRFYDQFQDDPHHLPSWAIDFRSNKVSDHLRPPMFHWNLQAGHGLVTPKKFWIAQQTDVNQTCYLHADWKMIICRGWFFDHVSELEIVKNDRLDAKDSHCEHHESTFRKFVGKLESCLPDMNPYERLQSRKNGIVKGTDGFVPFKAPDWSGCLSSSTIQELLQGWSDGVGLKEALTAFESADGGHRQKSFIAHIENLPTAEEEKYERRDGTPSRNSGNPSRIFTTQEGFLGYGPDAASKGDSLVLFPGALEAAVLRKVRSSPDEYIFVGFAWVQGICESELHKLFPNLDLEERDYCLR